MKSRVVVDTSTGAGMQPLPLGSTVQCGAGTTCTGNLVKRHFCDGLGACAAEAAGEDCTPYVCKSGA